MQVYFILKTLSILDKRKISPQNISVKFRLPIFYSVLILLLFSFVSKTSASGFALKTVGALNVDGITYKQLWYTNGNLSFTGIALANTQVTATIDSTSNNVTSDSSGNWSYGATLANGDHQVSFSSGGSSIDFTLTIGQVPEGIGSLPTTQTPTVGIITPTILLLSLGVLLVFSPLLKKVAL